ncbi:hypothetical protein HZH68_011378 [Vespula germanica]|uniref:Uncharacterized protein n=1 Tax=Vespula germanica TaxID=30212 RepID=A0A834N102_VESGE|nr:hypothetical protein HZH68_011378 [Vespula germanica]
MKEGVSLVRIVGARENWTGRYVPSATAAGDLEREDAVRNEAYLETGVFLQPTVSIGSPIDQRRTGIPS